MACILYIPNFYCIPEIVNTSFSFHAANHSQQRERKRSNQYRTAHYSCIYWNAKAYKDHVLMLRKQAAGSQRTGHTSGTEWGMHKRMG